MNKSQIEMMYKNNHLCPNVRKGVNLLFRLMQSVDAQSDGWAYWSAPFDAANKLMALLRTAGNIWRDTDGIITEKQLKDAITPIRRMVTTQRKKQLKYGNTFDFNVDAALLPQN